MIILILFSFLAGIVTILSPCILPILPIILSSSVYQDKKRPFGIVLGFIASFTFFTLFLSALVKASGISAESVRFFSIGVIGLFGLSLLVPQFQRLSELLFAKLSGLLPQRNNQNTGFWGGFVIGLSLGLLWTPCVGPILASVISLALSGSVTGSAVVITLAYSIGTAIPMFLIIRGGQNVLKKVPWLLKNSVHIQKLFGVVMILTALGIYLNIDRKFQSYILEKFPRYGSSLTQIEDNAFIRDIITTISNDSVPSDGKPMNEVLDTMKYPKAPELILGGQWFNTEPLTLNSLRGKVVLVDFWTYTCINCIRTLPYLKSWHEKYVDDGLIIIGVHSPEFEFEKSPDNVQKAITDFGLPYPVMQDNNFDTWKAYSNRYWPAKYLINKDGHIVYTHFGEGEYDETERKIQELLKETGATISDPITSGSYQNYARTPELYIGSDRFQPGYITFNGNWQDDGEYRSPSAGAILTLQFNAKEVFLVMRPKNGQVGKINISLDDKSFVPNNSIGEDVKNVLIEPDITLDIGDQSVWESTVDVTENRLYKLIKLPTSGVHTLELIFEDTNIELYAFTFG